MRSRGDRRRIVSARVDSAAAATWIFGRDRRRTSQVRACLAACDLDGSGVVPRADFVRPDTGIAAVLAANLGLRAAAPAPAPAPAVPRPNPNFDVTVRTNGGRTFAARDMPPGAVTEHTTVGDFKAIIAQVRGRAAPDSSRDAFPFRAAR